jgi:hypothetical protein
MNAARGFVTTQEEEVMKERRRSRRSVVTWRVLVGVRNPESPHAGGSGVLVNISSSGAMLFLDHLLDCGQKVDLWIRLPYETERWMKLAAEVVRIEGSSPLYRIAVRFSNTRASFFNTVLHTATPLES